MATTVQLDVPFLAEAAAEARALSHPYVGAEHFLIALARHGGDRCRRFFAGVGTGASALHAEVANLIGTPNAPTPDADAPLRLSLRAQVAIAAAIEHAHGKRVPGAAYGDLDLLAALLSDRVALPAVVGGVLERIGITPADARARLARLNG
jgi:ATP-dependent Clp protease ATP-binding subunit ClpA